LDKSAAWLKKSLDYEFKNLRLLEQALTHRSAPGINNERLEYLGDAVLDFVISEALYRERPNASEGVLSRLRSSLVKDTTLAELATGLDIGEHLILGSGEKKSGGHRRTSILADALEAIFAAVYLDSGFDEARRVIHNAFADRLVDIPDSAEQRDPKTRLQEFVQSRRIALPEYKLDASTTGQGTTRRDAEQQSAEYMLAMLDEAS
jgi:ribonuclease-3